MKCFICETEYDPKNRPYVATFVNRHNYEKTRICKVSNEKGTLALCPNCVKAFIVVCDILTSKYAKDFDLVDIPIVLEEE